ncbi:MAG: hypothetical protein IPO19_01735 [Rhodoferax sp.]|nr:hypothetical protein [Rhodoferax sp.]
MNTFTQRISLGTVLAQATSYPLRAITTDSCSFQRYITKAQLPTGFKHRQVLDKKREN